MKIKDMLPLHAALTYVAAMTNLDKSLNYCVAKNLLRLKKAHAEFTEENNLRLQHYAEKDPVTQEPIVIEGKYNFGLHTGEANKKYKELVEREIEFEPYTILRSEETDKLPGVVQQELLEIIIIDGEDSDRISLEKIKLNGVSAQV
jgi:hypothetical protein